ncbi:hypothetical protein [Bremerella cremea]
MHEMIYILEPTHNERFPKPDDPTHARLEASPAGSEPVASSA